MLQVANVQFASQVPCIVKVDPYAPLSFRTSRQPLPGARYVGLGDFKKQLLELQFPVDSLVLSGFTVVSAVADARGALTGVGPSKVGLPIVTLPQGEAFRGGGRVPRFDIQTNVAMSCADGQAEVRLGGAQTFNQRIVHGRVHFLLSNDFLVGLRVLDINEVERETLLDYMMHHPNRGGPS